MMGETFKYVAPIAGAMGYSCEDMSVAIGLMANSGIKGSMAGTSLKNVISNLANPTAATTKAINDLGISIKNDNGTMKTFEEVVGSLREGFADLTEEQKAQYAATIGGKQGMAGLLAIVNSGEEDFAALAEQINNSTGAAEEMAKIRLDNLNGDVTIMKSAWEGLSNSIGELFIPHMRTAVQRLCQDAGISLKVTAGIIVLFDASVYEKKSAIREIKQGTADVKTYRFSTSTNDTKYGRCHVVYTDPQMAQTIEYLYTPRGSEASAPTLEINERVTSREQARQLAMRRLRQKNRNEFKAGFTLTGDTRLVAGVTVNVVGWGMFDGKYIIEKATHNVTASGHTVQVDLRRVLEDL